MRFIGIDLAWSERNMSGVAVINASGTLVRASGERRTNEDIRQFGEIAEGTEAIIAIDASLIVKNAKGQRPVERQLTDIFGLYEAGPFPANLLKPVFQESGRIQRFVRLLEQLGFEQRPKVQKQKSQRVFLEVFPSPAQVVLFPCFTHNNHTHCRPPRFKYKAKRGWVQTQCEWEMYRARLLSLRATEPALEFSPEVKKTLGVDIEDYREVRYKRLDDLLDGIFCAYLAYYFWHWGEQGCWVVGDMESGYVTLPRCQLRNCPLLARLD